MTILYFIIVNVIIYTVNMNVLFRGKKGLVNNFSALKDRALDS